MPGTGIGRGYDSKRTRELLDEIGFDAQIACKGMPAPIQIGKRWVVERTLGWLSRARRLNRDHERRPDRHEQMVWWAGLLTLTRRMARQRLHWPERRAHRLEAPQP
ncbi:hypothetical protein [Streptacidiphilus sp. EB103A]|uniref:transposase n=1 Tax=Streptacidiphilus sp. EB103A TaxID=3156275 RepID=UPI0035129A58